MVPEVLAPHAPSDPARTYLLEQQFRYTYATPAHRLRHRLVVVPRTVHGGQCLFDHGLQVSGSPVRVAVSADGFANRVVALRAPVVAEWIEFTAWALVGHRRSDGLTPLAPATAADRRLRASTPLTRTDDLLAEVARDLAAGGGSTIDIATRACSWTHRALAYRHGVTGVHTTAAEAVAGGEGVCQDYAHVMLALCRSAGVPGRYVSGHLVGEGGSHAWVEVVAPDPSAPDSGRSVAVAFDPTHDCRATEGYLTVAVGRDYADVAPTSGSFVGECPGVLSTRKRLTLAETHSVRPRPRFS